MKDWIKDLLPHARMRHEAEEQEKIARLEAAENRLRELQERGERARGALTARSDRNHWREGIERMIQGVG